VREPVPNFFFPMNAPTYTSVGLGSSPGWETPSSPGFPTEIANPGLKTLLVPGRSTEIDWGILVPVPYTNRD
jgi:hypothetical protein